MQRVWTSALVVALVVLVGTTVGAKEQDHDLQLRVARHRAKAKARTAHIFSLAAKSAAKVRRQDWSRPMPPRAYVWNNPEATWDRTQALIDWAEGRPTASEQARRRAHMRDQQSKSGGGAGAASLLQTNSGATAAVREPEDPDTMLQNWRLKVQDKLYAQEHEKATRRHFRNDVARVQAALSTLPEQKSFKAPSLIEDSLAPGSEALTMFLSTRSVARRIKNVARRMSKPADAPQSSSVSLLETAAFARAKGRARAMARAAAGARAESRVAARTGARSDDMGCIMCLYIMERLEQKVGFPSHDLHGDGEMYSNSQTNTYPGPAQYEKGMVQSQPQYSPIPGPGYSSGAFVQLAEAAAARVRGGPVDPASDAQDYETMVSNKQNLEQRMRTDFNYEPREHLMHTQQAQQDLSLRSKLRRAGVRNVQFIDTGSLARGVVGGGKPVQTDIQRVASRLQASHYMDRQADEARMANRRSGLGMHDSAQAFTASALASAYDAAHDPYLGLRPEDNLDAGSDAAPGASAMSFLETRVRSRHRARIKDTDAAHARTGMVGSLVGGVAAATGAGIKCPAGMPFCRKALRRIGRRGLARRERRAAKDKEMSDTMSAMSDAIGEMQVDFPQEFRSFLTQLNAQLNTVASEYLHDYSDEEICSDIKMCTVGFSANAQLPISRSAFDTVRL